MFNKTRMDESRQKLEKAFYFALGVYSECEAKKGDSWRDQSIGQLYAHLAHEIGEIKTNINKSQLTYLIHNAADAINLATMLLVRAIEETPTKEKEVK